MKKTAILSTALCLSLLAAGCTSNEPTQGTEPSATTETSVTTEAETSSETTTEPAKAEHQVTVEEVVLLSSKEGAFEYKSVVPKIIVDGKEATEINEALSNYIQQAYPLEMDGDHASGMATRLAWGVKDNIISIVIYASETFTDYFNYDVFNYDLDTLKGADDSAVIQCFGMTDEDFFSKTKDAVKDYCTKFQYDTEKSLAAVNYEKTTPFITPDGNLGVAASIAYPEDSQFSGDSTRCFDLSTKDVFSIKG